MSNGYAVASGSRKRATHPPRGGHSAPTKLEESLSNSLRFFGSFLRQPSKVGSLVPSSATLARRMVEHCGLEKARTVVELGPGTGAITGPILARLGAEATFLALELDKRHVASLRKRYPRMKTYCDSAEHLEKYLRRHGRKTADCIVSGLPWANMGAELQDRILRPVVRVLESDGVFVGFGYAHARWLPTTQRFRKQLRRYFEEVRTTRVIWRNVPPAFVFHCRGPRRQGAGSNP